MAIIQTISATEPVRVLVECTGAKADVWLRDNIEQDTMEQTQGEDVVTCDFYRCDEVHFVVAGTPTVEEIEADFDALWDEHADDRTPAEKAQDTADAAQAQADYTAALTDTLLPE